VSSIKDLQLARLHRRAELIEQSRSKPRRLGRARRILQTADGRLRGQRLPALRTAADRELHQRIVPQPVEVDCILVPAGDRQNTRHHHLEHRMPDAVRIAAIGHCFGEPPANAMFALRLPQKQQAAVGRLVAAGKIDGEFLASDRWQVERKRRVVSHSGCGAGVDTRGNSRNISLLCESGTFRNRSLRNSHAGA
jgi:hypothetical protein